MFSYPLPYAHIHHHDLARDHSLLQHHCVQPHLHHHHHHEDKVKAGEEVEVEVCGAEAEVVVEAEHVEEEELEVLNHQQNLQTKSGVQMKQVLL